MNFSENNSNQTHQQFIVNYLSSMWDDVLDEKLRTVFFNLPQEEATSKINQFISKIRSEATISRAKLTDENYRLPYYPILNLLKEYLAELSESEIEEYVAEADIYQLHKPIFINFFNQRLTERDEELILEELEYEQQQMLNSILSLFFKLTEEKGPLIVIVENLGLAEESTLRLIQFLLNDSCKSTTMFIFSFDKNQQAIMSDNKKKKWDSFIKIIETENMIINLNNRSQINNNLADDSLQNSIKIEELIQLSTDCLNLFALEEAKEYLTEAYNRYQKDNSKLNQQDYIKLLDLLGTVYNYLGADNDALLNYQALADYLKKNGKPNKLADVYRKIAVVHFKKYNLETAEKIVKRGLRLVLDEGDEEQLVLIYFLICLIQERRKEYSAEQWQNLYSKAVPLAKKLGMDNTLASFYTHFHYIYYIEVVEQNNKEAVKKIQNANNMDNIFAQKNNNSLMGNTYYKEVLKIAKKYQNKYRLAAAYQLKAVIYSGEGNQEQVLNYYEKSKDLKEELDIKIDLAYVYNGLGYHYSTREEYKQAFEYHNQALNCLREVKDYHEIAMTCLNQGLNLFFAEEYQQSIFYLNELLEILRVLQLDIVMYQSQEKIYSLLGINYLKTGNLAKAEECIIKLKFEDTDKSSGDILEPFFMELFSGLYYKEKSNYEDSKDHFEKALLLLNDIEYSIKYVYPRFYYEYGLMLKKFNRIKEAKKIFNRGLEYCEELDFDFHQDLILDQLGATDTVNHFEFEAIMFDFDWIAESAELEETLNKFHNQINRVKFLNKVQNVLVEHVEKEKMIDKIIELIEYNFLVENSYLYLNEKGDWINYSKTEDLFSSQFELEEFMELILARGEELITSHQEEFTIREQLGDFNSVILIPLQSQNGVSGCLFCSTVSGDLELTADDLQILSILGKQLAIALERIAKDDELKRAHKELQNSYQKVLELSKTDFLTGLYNRFELIKKLKQEKNRIERYQRDNLNHYSVMYIDLDNFKYYNDQFGHDIGDLVLCKFAELLEKETREVDFVSRFGGDEFVVALPETKAESSYSVAKRIQEGLIEADQFCNDISDKLETDVEIISKNRLTCSIGIAENNPIDGLSNDQVLNRADQALYNVKNNGKDQIEIWTED
jgi:diguanylate cyclase (GGDEF)-like protein